MSTRSATESHAAKKVRISTGVHTERQGVRFRGCLRQETATPPQAYSHGGCGAFQSATLIEPVALSKPPQAYSDKHCGGVAFSNSLPEPNDARPSSNGAHGRFVPPDERRPALGPDGDSLDDFK
jgi:hypothetical protein